MLAISDDAFDLIVAEEDTGEAYYTRHYEHFEWPQGASGPTIGIGYDCGYVTTGEARVDWDGIVPDIVIDAIVTACGLRGQAAEFFVRTRGNSVTITWDEAIAEFRQREMPKWIARVQAALPNCDKLSPTSFGAIISLSYNRGTGGYSDPSARFAEMRAIKACMLQQNFKAIPAEFLSMRRLWAPNGDLWRRRGHEAALFQKGLAS